MRIQIYIGVSLLILIQKSASEAVSRLSPPANVSIQCDNYGVEVRWEYPDLSNDVLFVVEVKDNVDKNVKAHSTHNLSVNISSMLFNPAYNSYVVNVTAKRGQEWSKSVFSDVFSFNKHATSTIKCYLDFPEVKLSAKDGELHVWFVNPPFRYRNTPALRNLSDILAYTIETEETEVEARCEANLNTCETSVQFESHKGNYCVILSGNIGQRPLKLRSECLEGDIRIYTHITVYLYSLLGVVVTLVVITGIIMLLVTKYKADIKKEAMSTFRDVLDFRSTQIHQCKPLKPERETVDENVRIEPAEEPKEETTLLEISSDEEQSCGSKDLGSGDSETKRDYEGHDLLDDNPDTLSDGYDCPHVHRQEMSPGDLVEVYRL